MLGAPIGPVARTVPGAVTTPEIMRVLIGPVDDSEALNQRKAQLQTEGLETFVREY